MAHWYKKDGTPYYEVPKADGKGLRDATLADARKVGAVPSVTTIIHQLAKGNLDRWKQTKLLETVEKHQGMIGKHDKWKEMLIGISEEDNMKYAKRGNEIHDKLEQYYLKEIVDKEDRDYLDPVIKLIKMEFGYEVPKPELAFSHSKGFGGKIDLVLDDEIIIDFKTKSGAEIGKKALYDDYYMQLSAYREGLKLPKAECYNLLISVTNPGVLYLHKWSEEELEKGLKMFSHLLEVWKLKNNYNCEFRNE